MFGLPTWAIKPLLYLAGVAAIAVGLWAIHHHIDAAGYARGKSEVLAAVAERDRIATKAANDKIQELQTAARAKEASHASDIANIATDYEMEVLNEKAKSDDLARRVALGNIRLFDASAKCAAASGDGGVPKATTSAGIGDGQAGAELSGQATRNLFAEADRANLIVLQLTECQKVTQADRK